MAAVLRPVVDDLHQAMPQQPFPLLSLGRRVAYIIGQIVVAELWPLLWVMVIHLILSFPVRKWPLTRRPRLVLAALYGIAVAGPLVGAFTGTLAIHVATVIGLAALMIVAFFGALIHNLRAVRDPIRLCQRQVCCFCIAMHSPGHVRLAGRLARQIPR